MPISMPRLKKIPTPVLFSLLILSSLPSCTQWTPIASITPSLPSTLAPKAPYLPLPPLNSSFQQTVMASEGALHQPPLPGFISMQPQHHSANPHSTYNNQHYPHSINQHYPYNSNQQTLHRNNNITYSSQSQYSSHNTFNENQEQ